MRSHYCGQVNKSLVGQEVTVAGWVHRRRDHGGVIFVDLRDREGLLQVVFDPDDQAQFNEAEKLRNEFVVTVRGLVEARALLIGDDVKEPERFPDAWRFADLDWRADGPMPAVQNDQVSAPADPGRGHADANSG